jgi:hypothetical protein
MTKLTGALPKGQANGLPAIARQLVDKPDDKHIVIAIIDTKKIVTDIDSGDAEPVCRVLRIEPIEGDDKEQAAQILRRSLEQRTGQTVLPLDLEDEITDALGNVDLETGEIKKDGADE